MLMRGAGGTPMCVLHMCTGEHAKEKVVHQCLAYSLPYSSEVESPAEPGQPDFSSHPRLPNLYSTGISEIHKAMPSFLCGW